MVKPMKTLREGPIVKNYALIEIWVSLNDGLEVGTFEIISWFGTKLEAEKTFRDKSQGQTFKYEVSTDYTLNVFSRAVETAREINRMVVRIVRRQK